MNENGLAKSAAASSLRGSNKYIRMVKKQANPMILHRAQRMCGRLADVKGREI
jgi:hypothetical protein